jgi:hypothetical protein
LCHGGGGAERSPYLSFARTVCFPFHLGMKDKTTNKTRCLQKMTLHPTLIGSGFLSCALARIALF